MTDAQAQTIRIAAAMLAAGGSRRLGTPKQLLRAADDGPLLVSLVHALLGCEVVSVSIIVGHAANDVQALVRAAMPEPLYDKVRWIHNTEWTEGMASSIRAAVAAAGDADGLLLVACDQPAVTAHHLQTLLHHFAHTGQRVVSSYGETRGIPAVWPRSDFATLGALIGDRGAKGLLRGDEREVPLPNGALDLDTPDDVAQWRRTMAQPSDH